MCFFVLCVFFGFLVGVCCNSFVFFVESAATTSFFWFVFLNPIIGLSGGQPVAREELFFSDAGIATRRGPESHTASQQAPEILDMGVSQRTSRQLHEALVWDCHRQGPKGMNRNLIGLIVTPIQTELI